MPDLPVAHTIRLAGLWTGAHGTVILDHETRFLRRKRLETTAGEAFLVDLQQTANLSQGDALVLEDGRLIAVQAAEEPLLEVRGDGLARLAWHIGNRHTPCQIEADHLLIRADPVLEDMLRRLGATVRHVVAAFRPEGGAYGHGRTMGHSHSHDQMAMAEPAAAFGPDHGAPPHRHVRFHVSHLTGSDDALPEAE
jgi:urease accessory protein